MASEKCDLIDRRELIKAAERAQFAIADNTHPYKAISIQGMYFRGIVEDAPTVDAVPVVHGYWDDSGRYRFPSGKKAVRCNICGCALSEGEYEYHYFNWNYCPACGAKMDGDGNG